MKRLTERTIAGTANVNYKGCTFPNGKKDPIAKSARRQLAIERLAAIEDILGDEYDLDRLRELVQADLERRCVVMPCKIGDPVWRLYDDCDFPGDCYTKQKCRGCEYRNLFIEEQAFCLSMLCQNGKLDLPYYTTLAEAMAALRREQDG